MKTVNVVVSLLCFLCTVGLVVKIDSLKDQVNHYKSEPQRKPTVSIVG